MQLRVLRTSKATLSKVFYLDEAATGASGNVAVTITRMDGSAVQSGNATGPDANNGYTFTFNGLDVLDELVVTWAATVGGDAVVLDQDRLQVVGGFFFSLGQARAFDPAFSNTTKYPTADLIQYRIETEDEAEQICGQAFVPRFCRETLSPMADHPLLRLTWPLLRKVRALSVNGVAWTQAQLDAIGPDPLGMIRQGKPPWAWYWNDPMYSPPWPQGRGNIIVEYEHGMDTPPSAIYRGARFRMKSFLLQTRSPAPDRQERTSTTATGVVTLGVPGPKETGIPEVDAAYAKHPSPRPDFG